MVVPEGQWYCGQCGGGGGGGEGKEGEEGEESEGEWAEGLRLHVSSSSNTGYKGVYAHPSGRYEASRNKTRGGRRKVYIGLFRTAVEAAVAYARAVEAAERAAVEPVVTVPAAEPAAGAAGAALSPLSAVAAAAAGVLAAASPNDVAYGVGQCFLHRRQNYRGVIVGVDRECRQSEAWVSAMHVGHLKHGRMQPFYHVLADTRDRPGDGIGYVPQELLLLDTPTEPLQHPLTASLFGSYDARRGRFLLKGGGAAEGEGAAAEDALSAVVDASAQGLSITVTSGGQQQAVEPGEEEAGQGEAGQDGGGWVIIDED
mmetsp:Transcript_35410/g.113825  ORF Transcript_35410/g.113825 Transcript_35410/m.113825 type:complete len:314 (-) Transcript_35410:106-1047(-)